MPGLHASTRLGDLLVKKGKISRQQLWEAIRVQEERGALNLRNGLAPSTRNELGALLIELGFISRKQLRNCLSWQRRLRKLGLVMTFFAPLLTVACGGGGSGDAPLAVTPQTSSVSSTAYSSKAAVSSVLAFSSVSVSSVQQQSSSSLPPSSSSAASSKAKAMIDGPVLINWSPPTHRENGDYLDIAEVGGYQLRYKLKGATDYKRIEIKDGYTDSYYFDYLKGDYVFEIAAFDSNGIYSDFVAILRQ